MTKTLLKSSPTNRLEAIVEGLIHASNMALKHADMPLSRMPEYFMAVHVAQHIAKSFANFGYRLEASVKQTLSDAGVLNSTHKCNAHPCMHFVRRLPAQALARA